MENKKIFTSKFIAGVGILTAIEVVLYIIGASISIGGININLALIPMALGAIFYGPICGLFLGFVNGVATLLTPAVQGYFMNTAIFGDWCIFGTIIVCLVKSSVAGLVSGIIYQELKKYEVAAIIVASLIVPVINTGLFICGALIFFNYDMAAIVATVFTFNFLIEFGSTAILTPAIIRLVRIQKSRTGNVTIKGDNKTNEE